MGWLDRFRDPHDADRAAGGPRLLLTTFGRTFWYFPSSAASRLVHEGRGKYYGVAAGGPGESGLRELWVVSRPDQERDDRLLRIDQWRGKVLGETGLATRDTHQAVRRGDHLYVTDTFRGRVLVYSLPGLELVRTYAHHTHENHLNSVLIEDRTLLVLLHNKGKSHMDRLDAETGAILDRYPDVGENSHDIAPWRDEYLLCDSRGGALVAVGRDSKRLRVLHRDEGHFTKGLSIVGDTAYFATSEAAVRGTRHQVQCELVAYDLANDRVAWRRRLETHGLVNMIASTDDLLRGAGSPGT